MTNNLQKPQSEEVSTLAVETALGETQEIFRLLVSAIEDYAIFALDPNGNILTWNNGALQIKGYKADEVIGTHFSRFYTPEDIARHHPEEELKIATKNGKYEEEGWRIRKDGTRFWANVVITALKDSNNTLKGFAKVTRDLTERRNAEQSRLEDQKQKIIVAQVKENEKLLDQIFSEAPSFMTVLSVPEYRYLKSNSQHFKLMNKWDIVGKTVLEVAPELESQGFIHILDEVVKTGNPFIGTEVPITYIEAGADRLEYLDVVFQPLRHPSGEAYAISAQGYTVTERVLSRKAIENERQNFRNLFRQTPEMVCILSGPDHVFEFVNEAHIHALGFDATGRSVRNAQPDSIEIHGILDEVYKTGKTAQLHEIQVTVLGKIRFFNLTYAARKDIQDNINGIMILGVEVTEQIHSRQAISESRELLKKSEESFRTLAETIPQIVWTTASDGRITYYNKRWQDYTGFSLEQSQKHGMIHEIHPSDLDRVMKEWTRVKRMGDLFSLEYRLKGKDGTYRWFIGQALPLRDSAGDIIQWFGTTTEIDRTKRAEVAQSFLNRASDIFSTYRDYKQTLQAVADLAVTELADWCGIDILNSDEILESIAVAHKDPTMVEFAREFRSRYPVEMDAPTGPPKVLRTGEPDLYPFIPDELLVQSAKDEMHLEMMRKLKLQSLITVPLRANGRTFGTLTFVLSDPDHQYGYDDLSTATELARRAALAIDNARLFTKLRAAIQARDEFMSIASHELKTPLTSMKLQSQIRNRDIKRGELKRFSPDKLPKLVEDDEKQLNRLIRLVDDMLDASRINTGKLSLNPETFDLCEMIKETLTQFAPQIEAVGSSVSFKSKDECPIIGIWDRFRFEQVFINLLTNALKYGAERPIEILAETTSESALLIIIDHGMGIAQVDQKRIFEQFERAVSVNSISGLGVGLFISKKIVEAHGGIISLKSDIGRGSTFTVVMPLNSLKSGEHKGGISFQDIRSPVKTPLEWF